MKKLSTFLLTAATCFFAANAYAGDTTELLENGQIEVVPSFSLANIHKGKPGVGVGLDVGYGVTDWMTVTASLGMESAVALLNEPYADIHNIEADGVGLDFGMDLLFTPVDTEHFDMDVHVGFGTGFSIVVTPGLEFNFDSSNEMDGWGLFATLDTPIYSGLKFNQVPADAEEAVKTDFGLDFALGGYVYVAENHQLIIIGGIRATNLANKLAKPDLDEGFVNIGWNHAFTDNFELTTEVEIDIPKGGDGTYASIGIGGIFDFNPIK